MFPSDLQTEKALKTTCRCPSQGRCITNHSNIVVLQSFEDAFMVNAINLLRPNMLAKKFGYTVKATDVVTVVWFCKCDEHPSAVVLVFRVINKRVGFVVFITFLICAM